MNKALKAALFSAFILPGAGHLLLKRYITALLLLTITLTSAYIMIADALENAMLIVERIQRGEVAADIATITQLATQQSASNGLFGGDLFSTILLITWIIAIIDSYRVGRSAENKKHN